jgi:hypothetical protein
MITVWTLVEKELGVVWENMELFQEDFIGMDGIEVYSISLHEDGLEYQFWDVDTGQHFSDGIRKIDYLKWRSKIDR